VLHTSTSEVYGSARYTPMDEKHPLQGQSPYSASKIGADKIAESYARSFGLPVVTIRPFNTFGPRQSTRAVIPTIISQALLSEAIHLGSLETQRDLTYVQDTVAGFIAGAKAGPEAHGQEINLGVGETISVGALAARILALMQVSKPIVQDAGRLRPVDSEVDRLLSDNTKARALLGWGPRVRMEEGLRETISFMRENAGDFSPHAYSV
jgi:nucleoside-diphosphate-sugar epimerase